MVTIVGLKYDVDAKDFPAATCGDAGCFTGKCDQCECEFSEWDALIEWHFVRSSVYLCADCALSMGVHIMSDLNVYRHTLIRRENRNTRFVAQTDDSGP